MLIIFFSFLFFSFFLIVNSLTSKVFGRKFFCFLCLIYKSKKQNFFKKATGSFPPTGLQKGFIFVVCPGPLFVHFSLSLLWFLLLAFLFLFSFSFYFYFFLFLSFSFFHFHFFFFCGHLLCREGPPPKKGGGGDFSFLFALFPLHFALYILC